MDREEYELLHDVLSGDQKHGYRPVNFSFWYWLHGDEMEGWTEDEKIERWKRVSVFENYDFSEDEIKALKMEIEKADKMQDGLEDQQNEGWNKRAYEVDS